MQFEITPKFRNVMERFQSEYFLSFPNVPCSFCDILSLPRLVVWKAYDVCIASQYELETVLHHRLAVNNHQRIAVCQACDRKPRRAPNLGPSSEAVLAVPQRWRPLLSPIKINCSLGRTQSHSVDGYHNPYSTYRTLSGITTCNCGS